MSATPFQNLWDDLENDPEYLATLERMRFTSTLGEIMEENGTNRKDLANTLGVSQSYVTQVLRGDANFTIETMMKFAMALSHRVRFEVHPAEGEWTFHGICRASKIVPKAAITPTPKNRPAYSFVSLGRSKGTEAA